MSVNCLQAEDHDDSATSEVVSATASLQRLIAGNERFMAAHPMHGHENANWRHTLLEGQHPFAAVVGCADSRVPPELIFDQGFGDLFVIRNAGNLMATDVLASIEYAVAHLNTRLVVIMGHESCGAVTAALTSREQREKEPLELQAVLQMINVALADQKLEGSEQERIAAAVAANVKWAVKQLRFLLLERGNTEIGETRIVGAVYDMHTGKVQFLD